MAAKKPTLITRGFVILLSIAVIGASAYALEHRRTTQLEEKQKVIDKIEADFKLAQKNLAESEKILARARAANAAYSAFLKDSPYPVVIIDSDGDVLLWNKAAEEDSGYTFEEMVAIDRSVQPIIPPEMREEHATKRILAFENEELLGKLQIVECDRLHKNGGRRRIVVSVMMFRSDSGEVFGLAQWVRKSRVDGEELPSQIRFLARPKPL